jgi:hypothetical protein
MCMDFKWTSELVYVPPQPQPPGSMNLHPLNCKSEVDLRKTFKYWRVLYMDVNQLAAAGFFFTNRRCASLCVLWSGSRTLD